MPLRAFSFSREMRGESVRPEFERGRAPAAEGRGGGKERGAGAEASRNGQWRQERGAPQSGLAPRRKLWLNFARSDRPAAPAPNLPLPSRPPARPHTTNGPAACCPPPSPPRPQPNWRPRSVKQGGPAAFCGNFGKNQNNRQRASVTMAAVTASIDASAAGRAESRRWRRATGLRGGGVAGPTANATRPLPRVQGR